MKLILVGLSHKTAPVEVREKLAFPEKHLPEALKSLHGCQGIREGLILSTCNRVEILVQVEDTGCGVEIVEGFIANYRDIAPELFFPHLYVHLNEKAVHHLFRVACSLDSMVVGEPQILGQLKDAYQAAVEGKTVGQILNGLLHRAFNVAKKVRTETGIGQSAVSVSFAAVELARKIFEDLQDKTVLILGAGEMSELVAQHLISNGVHNVLVSNRTYERGEELAAKFTGQVIRYENLKDELHRVDILISSTGAPHLVIHHEDVQRAVHTRRNRPMFFIDIAVPRDIDPKVNELDDVYLYDIDDLQAVVEANIRERRREAKIAEEIIAKETQQVMGWWRSLDVVPTIIDLRGTMDNIRQEELARALPKLKNLSPEEKKAVDVLTQGLINKILHKPIVTLKKHASNNNVQPYIEVIRKLFDLDKH